MPAIDPVTGVTDAVTSVVDEVRQHEALKNSADMITEAVAVAFEAEKEKLVAAVTKGDLGTLRKEVAE